MSDDGDLTLTLHTFNGDEDDSNDEMDWEEVEVPEQAPQEQQPLMQIVLRPDNEAQVPTKCVFEYSMMCMLQISIMR